MKSYHVYYFVISLLHPWPTLEKQNRAEHSRMIGKLLCEILLCWSLFHTYTHARVCVCVCVFVCVIVLSQNRKCISYCGLQSKWFKKIFFIIIIFFYFTILYWFCHTSTCIRHGCTCVPHLEPPSHLPPHTIPLPEPKLSWFFSTCLVTLLAPSPSLISYQLPR